MSKACIAHSHHAHPTEIWARGKCNQGSSCESRCGCLYADLAVQKIGFTPASNIHPCLLQKRSGGGTLKAKFLFLFAHGTSAKHIWDPKQRVGRQLGGSGKCSSKAQQENFTQINSSRACDYIWTENVHLPPVPDISSPNISSLQGWSVYV